MFNYPATEVYNQTGGYCVAWSKEQFETLLAEGWTVDKPALADELPPLGDAVKQRRKVRPEPPEAA